MPEKEHISEYLDGFASYMETSTRLSVISRKKYLYEVRRFIKDIGDPPLSEVTARVLQDWNARFYAENFAASTVIQKHSALAKFFTYLFQIEELEYAGRLLSLLQTQVLAPRDKGATREAYALEPERFTKMMDAAGKNLATGLRDRAVLHFLYSTGVRNSELTGLTISDLDLKERMATVHGKRAKTRMVVFDEACQRDLQVWLDDRATWPTSDYVFCSNSGRRMDPSLVSIIVKKASKGAGFRKAVWPHVFRHTAITRLLDAGMYIQDTAVFAGHDDPATTMRYFHQGPQRLKEQYDKATQTTQGE